MLTSTNTVPRISYHYPCPDGIFSALAAHLKFSRDGQKVVWIPNAVYAPKQLDELHLQVVPFAGNNKQLIWEAAWALAPISAPCANNSIDTLFIYLHLFLLLIY